VEYVVKLVIGIKLIEASGGTPRDADGDLVRHVEDSIAALEHRWNNDCAVEMDLKRAEATYTVVVDTGDETRAISQARGLLSIAIHAAGGATPHRPFPRDASWSVRLVAAWADPAPAGERSDSRGPHRLDSERQCEPHVLGLSEEQALSSHKSTR
jgi:hypothetical protein